MIAAQPWLLHTDRVGSMGPQGQAVIPHPRANFRPSWAEVTSTAEEPCGPRAATALPTTLPQDPWRPSPPHVQLLDLISRFSHQPNPGCHTQEAAALQPACPLGPQLEAEAGMSATRVKGALLAKGQTGQP